jgi:hypothetical protein
MHLQYIEDIIDIVPIIARTDAPIAAAITAPKPVKVTQQELQNHLY